MSNKRGLDLKDMLEKAQQGFAYEMLALEIQLQQKQLDHPYRSECLSKLLQLYMIAVECLESKSDQRYKYFSSKIQQLMRKKLILQEMNTKAIKKLDPELLLEVRRKELGERKEEYDMQMYLSSEQVNQKKIKELVEVAESKLRRHQTKIQSNISNQDKELQERIKRRKMRSEAGSVEKFKVYKGKVVGVNLANTPDDYFQKVISKKVAYREEPARHFRSVHHV